MRGKSHAQNMTFPSKESLITTSVSPQPTTPSSNTSYSTDEATLSLLTSLIHVAALYSFYTQDIVLLHSSLTSFVQTSLEQSISSKEKELILKAVQMVINQDGGNLINVLYNNILLINLLNASTSLSNVRSITSSYRMTNKPCIHISRQLISQLHLLLPFMSRVFYTHLTVS